MRSADQQAGDLRRRRLAVHDRAPSPRRPRRSVRSSLALQLLEQRRRTSASPGSCAAAAGPRPVSTDSGWNCTPCIGHSRWRSAHDRAVVVGARRDLERRRAARPATRPASGSASPRSGCGEAGEDALAVVLDRPRSCRASARGARTTRPPNASPIAWWPRQTPRIGTRRAEALDHRRSRCRRPRAGPGPARSRCATAPAPRSRRA